MPLPGRTFTGKKKVKVMQDPGSLFEQALKSMGYELCPDLKAVWEEVKKSGKYKGLARKNVVNSSPEENVIAARESSMLWHVERETGVPVPPDLAAAWDTWVKSGKNRAPGGPTANLLERTLSAIGVQFSAESNTKAPAQRDVANSSTSLNFQTSPSSQRKRPRGSEGGKSIHKAAEAPTVFRGASPAPSSYRKSLGLEKASSDVHNQSRIYPAPRKSYTPVAARNNFTTTPAINTLPSPSSASPLDGTSDLTDFTTPEPQVARKTVSIAKSKTPRLPQAVSKKAVWKGKAKRNGSESPESGSQESEGVDSDSDKSSSDTFSDLGDVRRSSSSMPSPREILSHIGRSKSRVTTHIPYSLDSPAHSRQESVTDDVTSSPTHGFPDTVEPFLPSTQLTTAPPQALIDAFEVLTINTITLQRARRLPFLLRNLRTGFQNRCQQLGVLGEVNPLPDNAEVWLTYRYTATSGARYTYQIAHGRRECPLCSIFGQFSSWQALTKHMGWSHDDVDFAFDEIKSSEGVLVPNLIVHLKDDTVDSSSLSDLSSIEAAMAIERDTKLDVEHTTDAENFTTSRSSSHPSSSSIKLRSSNEATNSSDVPTPDVVDDPGDSGRPSVPPILSLRGLTSSLPVPLATPDSQYPPVPPLDNLHGPACPIPHPADVLSTAVVPKTYRPTGPHLFDHLSPLPLEAFGHRSWFVLDKEEEIFELTDVLDEDKVICALWGRWILLNRSFFIASYIAGVEAFVDEYWLVIHQAAGWGALRAWLLVLVSRRLLKNVEMVQVLKKYNALVGKDKWPKPTVQE